MDGSQEVMELQGVAIISRFAIKVFDPSDMQNVEFKYAPAMVQLQVGMCPDKYDYESPIFTVNQETCDEQSFDIAPDLCCGRYIRLRLIDKPHKQDLGGTESIGYYVALNYVGVKGVRVEKLNVDG